jgi:hypothetical protein
LKHWYLRPEKIILGSVPCVLGPRSLKRQEVINEEASAGNINCAILLRYSLRLDGHCDTVGNRSNKARSQTFAAAFPKTGTLNRRTGNKAAPADNPTPKTKTQTGTQQPPSGQQQKPGSEVDEKQPVIVNTDLITFNVTVTDIYGRFVSGLSKNAFNIFDEKQQQEITFFSDDDAPLSVGIVFDLTGSMSGEKVKRAKDALAHFFQTSHDSDEY